MLTAYQKDLNTRANQRSSLALVITNILAAEFMLFSRLILTYTEHESTVIGYSFVRPSDKRNVNNF